MHYAHLADNGPYKGEWIVVDSRGHQSADGYFLTKEDAEAKAAAEAAAAEEAEAAESADAEAEGEAAEAESEESAE